MNLMRIYPISLIFIGAAASLPALADMSQEEALLAAAAVQKTGSDASLQNSTTNAMKGLMDLAAQKRTSAIQHGYKAYGQYRNSEELDLARMKSKIRANEIYTTAMKENKAGIAGAKYVPDSVENYKTTFARLDPKFLREGEAGKVAAEFEKQTGMKREKFLKIMAKASESTISPSDPKMVDKVISRFEGFLREIPNDDFRKNVQKTIDQVPSTMRHGMIAKGVQKIAEIMAKLPADKTELQAKAVAPAETERKPAALAVTGVETSGAATAPTPTSGSESDQAALIAVAATSSKMIPAKSEFQGIDKESYSKGDMIGSVMQTALEEQREDTIFKQVSRRYRAMMPKLGLITDEHP